MQGNPGTGQPPLTNAGGSNAMPLSPTSGGGGAPGGSGTRPNWGGVANGGGSPSFGPGGAGSTGGAPSIGMGGTTSQSTGGQGQSVPVGGAPNPSKGCEGEMTPPVTGDYSANGPMQTTTINKTGSDGNYTVVRPTQLGQNGFKHPIVTWGNGITTDPTFYPQLLGAIASHGFVVIASNSTTVTAQLMTAGLDWMIAQNGMAGDYQGKLNTTCLAAVGYSLGGGGAVGAGAHANVVVTVSLHGVLGPANALHGPLLLTTSETDTVNVPSVMVTPTFNASTVQTFYGTISKAGDASNEGHLIPVDGALAIITDHGANLAERAATIAWLRLWVYSDAGAKKYFYGDGCIACMAPWTMPQRKNWM